MSKYDFDGSQAQYQPGSNNEVLANKLDITDSNDMDEAELKLLEDLYVWVLNEVLPEGAITTDDLKTWHRCWLGNVYPWAGQERSVNISKGNFHFAAAAQIPNLLAKLDKDYLQAYTPCVDMDREALVEAIAIVHVEFILIHPFREGNGRLSRLLADVMAVQARQEPLDYTAWDKEKPAYFAAIQTGMGMDYGPMKRFVEKALV